MERKETFDFVAAEYDRYRPIYPEELFDDLVEYSGITPSAKIFEIGCGTGQATSSLVQRGYTNLTCVELGANLARLASEKFKDYPKLKVINSSFEDWGGEDNSFDLAISGTAFHFIEPEHGYEKVNRLLKSGGSIGFFWTIHVQQYDELHAKIRDVYQCYASHLDDAKKLGPEEVISDRLRLTKEQGFFSNIAVKEYRWVDTYTSHDYISLLNTHSGHRQLPERTRNKLFASIKELIDVHGGCIDKQQLVALILGSKTQI